MSVQLYVYVVLGGPPVGVLATVQRGDDVPVIVQTPVPVGATPKLGTVSVAVNVSV